MKGHVPSGFLRDDGTGIHLGQSSKPSLCPTRRKELDPDEETLRTLTRADQQGEAAFECLTFAPKR